MSVCCQICSYSAVSVEEFLAENEMTVIPHLPYSPYLVLMCFHFPKVKVVLKGRRFNGIIMIRALSWVIPAHCQIVHYM